MAARLKPYPPFVRPGVAERHVGHRFSGAVRRLPSGFDGDELDHFFASVNARAPERIVNQPRDQPRCDRALADVANEVGRQFIVAQYAVIVTLLPQPPPPAAAELE